jgi:hypothetical protein
VEPIDLNKYQDFDRNDLYEKVRKWLIFLTEFELL